MAGEATASLYPEASALLEDLSDLLALSPPPFLYVHDPTTPRRTNSAIDALLTELSSSDKTLRHASLDAISCFSARIFYDTTINALTHHEPTWESGAANWGTERYNESLDAFLHGIRAAANHVAEEEEGRLEDVQMVLLVENAERMKDATPELLVPLARLYELAHIDITTIFVSEVSWEDMKPSLGAAPDPFRLTVAPPSKSDALARLGLLFPFEPQPDSDAAPLEAYAPTLRPLHAQYCSALYSVISPFVQDPDEMAYIAAARWPGFVQPLLDEHFRVRAEREAERAAHDEDAGVDLEEQEGDMWPPAPSEETRVRLLRHFTPTFTTALEQLYPRHTDAKTWAMQAAAEDTSVPPADGTADETALVHALPRLHKFIMLATYLASTNPAKSDYRIFGRLTDGKGKKKKGGGTRKTRIGSKAGVNKVPQRFLGPTPFPLDRLLAILGVLLEEHDPAVQASFNDLPGAATELELQRVGVYGAITELAASRLLTRTSNPEKLDGPPTYRSGIGYTAALALSKDLGIVLGELMWEAV